MGMLPVIFLLGLTVSAYSETCPPNEEMVPCVCENIEYTDNIQVKCKNDYNKFELKDIAGAMKHLVGKKKVEIEIDDFDLSEIPFDFFDGIDVINIHIVDSDVPSVTEEDKLVFVGLENSLRALSIHSSIHEHNDLSKLRYGHLRKLRTLDFIFNSITEVTNSWFEKSTLEVIRLSHNGIQKLGDRAFADLRNLKRLQLYSNEIATLKRSMLPELAEDLEDLNLHKNRITNLDEDIFSNMPALKEVLLSGNGIARLDKKTWESVWEQLTVVDLSDNPIVCDSDLQWTFNLRRPSRLEGKCSDGTWISSFIDNGKKNL